MKKLTSVVMAAAMGCVNVSSVLAASGVYNSTMKIGGASASVSTIDMIPDRTFEVMVANQKLDTHESGKSMVSHTETSEGEVVAAVNGGFFNLSDWSVCNSMVQDGKLIANGGLSHAVGMTRSGEILMDKVELGAKAKITKGDGGSHEVYGWSINSIYSGSDNCISFLNEYCRSGQVIPNGAVGAVIEHGVVTRIQNSGPVVLYHGQDMLVYNAAAVANAEIWGTLPVVGDHVEIGLLANPSKSGTKEKWEQAETVMGGAVSLVLDGRNVVWENQLPAGDQAPNSVRQRIFVAKMGNGQLVMGTVYSSYQNIADAMIQNGATDVIAMDGGSSSMLYSNGEYLKSAGRQLTMGLAVVDKPGTHVQQEPVNQNTSGSDPFVMETPAWEDRQKEKEQDVQEDTVTGPQEVPAAPVTDVPEFHDTEPNSPFKTVNEVTVLSKEESVPLSELHNENVNDRTQTYFSELDFADALIAAVEKKTGQSMLEFAEAHGVAAGTKIEALIGLGILDDVSAPIVARKDAAVAVQRIHSLLMGAFSSNYYEFADCGSLSGEELFSISYVVGNRMMFGTDKLFDPYVALTQEQADVLFSAF